MSEPPPLPDDAPPTLADLWEILRLPLLLALAALAATWLVWYLTSASCPIELAQTTGCNPSRVAPLHQPNRAEQHGHPRRPGRRRRWPMGATG